MRRKTSSGNYQQDRIHQYVIDGIKKYGNEGWITSQIYREGERIKRGKDKGKIYHGRTYAEILPAVL
jgi:hypothetical protein